MNQYELHHRVFYEDIPVDDDVDEVIGDVEIPEDAIGVNTSAESVTPPLVAVTWLERKDE
jgi:hypothetical protein